MRIESIGSTRENTKEIPRTEQRMSSLLFQILMIVLSAMVYMKTESIIAKILFGFFGINVLSIIGMILYPLILYRKELEPLEEKVIPKKDKALGKRIPLVKEKQALSESKYPVAPESNETNFQQILRKKNKIFNPPTKLVIKNYKEYKDKFNLTKELEKKFKQWVHTNVMSSLKQPNKQEELMTRVPRPLTRTEINELQILESNGLICYDKNNQAHSRALFKVLYNYFNSIIPKGESYYTNPMDEFVFEGANRIKISTFGLLVEDTESLIEGKKMFSVYFMEKNVLYNTEGDVIFAYLLLLVFANENTGGYLGTLSLRTMKFLSAK
ncbi:hypothetical protein NEOKW01_0061 [Nematocida sp. AWRm80]|nr:hypothetical protein NEOKW01_0061 [Nematocida sp. AWRm80]